MRAPWTFHVTWMFVTEFYERMFKELWVNTLPGHVPYGLNFGIVMPGLLPLEIPVFWHLSTRGYCHSYMPFI